jgi:hypothetical protein
MYIYIFQAEAKKKRKFLSFISFFIFYIYCMLTSSNFFGFSSMAILRKGFIETIKLKTSIYLCISFITGIN